ncbi:programmed cell death protein 10-like [Artemia franciscana]|uniref:programmed cell death protein 10-like n=1 Tax=Artemia franciscana TaxID=6661 RepID=UPI0032DBCD7A
MTDDVPAQSLMLPVLLRPVISDLEKTDVAAAQTLRAALVKVENVHPGFTHDLVLGLVKKADLSINMNEALLRLQGQVADTDSEYRLRRAEEPFQELNRRSSLLKKILSRIPDEITDRRAFLDTIKEIASAIKKLLDVVNEIAGYIPGSTGKQALEQRKRDFVRYSKKFSTTLKEYFREGQPSAVFASALYLIHQTNLMIVTIKNKCE